MNYEAIEVMLHAVKRNCIMQMTHPDRPGSIYTIVGVMKAKTGEGWEDMVLYRDQHGSHFSRSRYDFIKFELVTNDQVIATYPANGGIFMNNGLTGR